MKGLWLWNMPNTHFPVTCRQQTGPEAPWRGGTSPEDHQQVNDRPAGFVVLRGLNQAPAVDNTSSSSLTGHQAMKTWEHWPLRTHYLFCPPAAPPTPRRSPEPEPQFTQPPTGSSSSGGCPLCPGPCHSGSSPLPPPVLSLSSCKQVGRGFLHRGQERWGCQELVLD